LEDPLIFNEDYGLVTDWYDIHRSDGSTTIRKMQLRKEHVAPAYHEYILVLTQAGRTYRVDRGREGSVFDTIKAITKKAPTLPGLSRDWKIYKPS
jgi:hypothetical protein